VRFFLDGVYSHSVSTALGLGLLTLQHVVASSTWSLPTLQQFATSCTLSFLQAEFRISVASSLLQVVRV
jgi:hypothetical protein